MWIPIGVRQPCGIGPGWGGCDSVVAMWDVGAGDAMGTIGIDDGNTIATIFIAPTSGSRSPLSDDWIDLPIMKRCWHSSGGESCCLHCRVSSVAIYRQVIQIDSCANPVQPYTILPTLCSMLQSRIAYPLSSG
jgi:hypothetical protein